MAKDPSIQNMNACLGQAYEKWDLELNGVYQELSGWLNWVNPLQGLEKIFFLC